MNDRLDLRLLDRFLTGAASDEEQAVVRRWLAAHPGEAIGPDAPHTGDEAWDVDSAWTRLQDRLATADESPDWGADHPAAAGGPSAEDRLAAWEQGRLGPSDAASHRDAGAAPARKTARVLRIDGRVSRRSVRTWAGAGAALAAAASLLVVWRTGLLTTFADKAADTSPVAELVTGAGRRATLRLPDGTTVRLDAGSRLRYPARMAAGAAREVTLEGQAYFEVQHDATRSFTVRAGGARVRDIGTEFVVTAYPGATVSVVVARGSVAVRRAGAGREQTLREGEQARLDARGSLDVRAVDVRSYVAWTEGILAFDARPLRDVVPELGRWYGVEIRVPDAAVADRVLTAQFRDEPLARVLDAIAMALGARWQREGGIITVLPGSGS